VEITQADTATIQMASSFISVLMQCLCGRVCLCVCVDRKHEILGGKRAGEICGPVGVASTFRDTVPAVVIGDGGD